ASVPLRRKLLRIARVECDPPHVELGNQRRLDPIKQIQRKQVGLQIESKVAEAVRIDLTIAIFDYRSRLDCRHRKYLSAPDAVTCLHQQLVEDVAAVDFEGSSIGSYRPRMHVGYSTQLDSIRQLNISPPATSLVEDLYSNVHPKAGAVGECVVDPTFAKEYRCVRIRIADVRRGKRELALRDGFPRGCRRRST